MTSSGGKSVEMTTRGLLAVASGGSIELAVAAKPTRIINAASAPSTLANVFLELFIEEIAGGSLVDGGGDSACNVFQGSSSVVVWPAAATRRFAPARVAKPE
jgi:hypothetical protein